MILLTFLTVFTVWGNVTVGVTHYGITSDRLPDSFDGFRIAVVSDFHNAKFGSDNAVITEMIMREHPDIIAITGDLVDSRRTDTETSLELVKRLVQIAPCYYITGNHEARLGREFTEFEEELSDEGVAVLRNKAEWIERNGQVIEIVGLDDPEFSRRGAETAQDILKTELRLTKQSDDYCILLSHRPEAFEVYAEENADLVLAGHAHGGQIRLPFIGGLVAPGQGVFPKYDSGVFSENGTSMVVSRGIGNSLFPVRFNNRPEIVLIELTCGEKIPSE